MPAPATRYKILPARGAYAALNAAVNEIQEGEICYASDEDRYYQKEGNVLVPVGASKEQGGLADTALQPGDNVSELVNDAGYLTTGTLPPLDRALGDLTDVDLATNPPTSGQLLGYNGSEWVPADNTGLVTSVNGQQGDVVLDHADVGAVSQVDFDARVVEVDTALSNKADLVNGVVPNSQLPSVAITEYLGEVADETEMLALSGEKGDWCIRTDTSSTWILTGEPASTLGNWVELATPASPVTSVNGYTGAVNLSAADVGATEEAPSDGVQYVRQDGAWSALDIPPGTIVDDGTGLPASPGNGQLWFNTSDGRLYVYFTDVSGDSQWVDASPGGGGESGATSTVSDAPPADPKEGDLWWDSSSSADENGGRLYLRYEDQWVQASNVGAGGGGSGGGGETAVNYNGADAWGKVSDAGALNGGLNCTTEKTSTGQYKVTFNNPMPNADYAVTFGVRQNRTARVLNQSTTDFVYTTYDFDAIQSDGAINFAVFASNTIAPQYGVGADAWGYIASGGGIAGSFNVQSVTKTATGKYSVLFTTPMPNGNYAVSSSITASNSVVQIRSQTAAGFDVWTSTAGSGTLDDRGFSFTVFASSTVTPTYTWTRNGTTLEPANDGDSVDIGGNIELNADGTGTFSDVVTAKGSTLKPSDSSGGLYVMQTNGSSTAGAILANGNATFSGTLLSASEIKSTRFSSSAALGAASDAAFRVGSAAANIAKIGYDGSATFAKTVTGNDSKVAGIVGGFFQANDNGDASPAIMARNFEDDGQVFQGRKSNGAITSKIFADGNAWFDHGVTADTASFTSVTADTASFAGDIQSTSQNGGPLAGFRNQLINPNYTVQQRGTSFTSPDDEYTFDRWWMGNAAGRNVSISSDGPYQNAMLITNNTSDNVFLRQGIEIQEGKCGPFIQNSIWTLSLWSDAPGWVGRGLGVCAFRDAGKMNDSAGQVNLTAGTFAATGETGGGMSRYSLQIDIGSAQPAATNGMLCIGLSLPTGGLRISAVQLEPGPVATPFEHRPIATELALSQRYYCNQAIDQESPAKDAYYFMNPTCRFPVTMRTGPTVTVYAAGVTGSYSGGDANHVTELITNQYPATYGTIRASSIDYVAKDAFRIASSTGQLNAGNYTYRWSYRADAEL